MPYDINYNSALQIIELTHTGIVSEEDIRNSTDDGIRFQKEHNVYAILIDAIEIASVASAIEVHDLPRQYDEGGLGRSTRLAMVSPRVPAANEITQFYDNVCNNWGWRVESFGYT